MLTESANIKQSAKVQIELIKEKCNQIKPLVVSLTLAYNHEKYIRDTLDGFVMQKTNFPFVAIVHDDASTDGTTAIIHEYAEKYPDIVLPIYETDNQYSKSNGVLGRIMRTAANVTGAKYVAMCEGDDYWIDPLKLQKQVEFLDSHPDYSMCFGNAVEHWESMKCEDKCFSNVEDRDYSRIEILQNWTIPTASVLYRRIINQDKKRILLLNTGNIIASDIVLFLTCFKYGKIKGFSDFFSVYRRLESGVVCSLMDKQPYKFMIHEIYLGKYFGGEIKEYSKRRVAQRFVCELKRFNDTHRINPKYLIRAFVFAPMSCLKECFKYT